MVPKISSVLYYLKCLIFPHLEYPLHIIIMRFCVANRKNQEFQIFGGLGIKPIFYQLLFIKYGLNVGATEGGFFPNPLPKLQNPYFSDQIYDDNQVALELNEHLAGDDFVLLRKSIDSVHEDLVVDSDENSADNRESNFPEDPAEKGMAEGGLGCGGSNKEPINFEDMEVEQNYKGPHLQNKTVTAKFMQEYLKECMKPKASTRNTLHTKYVAIILRKIKEYFQKQPSLIDIEVPKGENITVVGDVHGSFGDVIQVLHASGLPSDTNWYLFNGDFVDRGPCSLECAITLFGFKLLYPKTFFINRGNHEDRNQNLGGGFNEECSRKYSPQMQELFQDVWTWLPLAHLINKRILVVHGGLPPQRGVTLDDIRRVQRGCDPEEGRDFEDLMNKMQREESNNDKAPGALPPIWLNDSLMMSLLWADPMDDRGVAWNRARMGGTCFGPDISKAFCRRNKIEFIIRSHEPRKWGFKVEHDGRVITLFSAAGYISFRHKNPDLTDTLNRGALIQMRSPELKTHFVVWSEEDRDEAWKSFEKSRAVS